MIDSNYVLKNNSFQLIVEKKGAEMSHFFHLTDKYEFIWSANPLIWNRHAPVLFPIVGKLNNDKILIDQKEYVMGQHGFARDHDFDLVQKTENSLTFLLIHNEETLKKYPFLFKFYIIYSFTEIENQLKITYKVQNLNNKVMPFSVGAHPGFKLPSSNITEYEIDFYTVNIINRKLLKDGLFSNESEILYLNNSKLQLSNELFDKDAIVVKNTSFKKISLIHKNSNFKIDCIFNDFNDLGIWAKKGNEDFICLEPWLGYADEIDFNEDIDFKKGIIKLAPFKTFEATYYLNFTI